MGQTKPFEKTGRNLSSTEQRAVAYLKWIEGHLGKKYKMAPYFAAMMIEEINEGAVIDGRGEPQLAVVDALAALSKPSS